MLAEHKLSADAPDDAIVAVCTTVKIAGDDPQWVNGHAEDLHEVRPLYDAHVCMRISSHGCRRHPIAYAVWRTKPVLCDHPSALRLSRVAWLHPATLLTANHAARGYHGPTACPGYGL